MLTPTQLQEMAVLRRAQVCYIVAINNRDDRYCWEVGRVFTYSLFPISAISPGMFPLFCHPSPQVGRTLHQDGRRWHGIFHFFRF